MSGKILVALISAAVVGVGANAMGAGGGGTGGAGGGGGIAGAASPAGANGTGKGGSGGQIGHANFSHDRFGHAHFSHRFGRNRVLLGGWDWGLGWPYDQDGYSNTNVVIYPQATPQMATGSVAATPCHWNAETFKVPSSGGGNRPVQIVACQ